MEERRSNFKKTLVKGEGSKKRLELAAKIRKDKRERSISSKRSRLGEDEGDTATVFSPADILLALQQLQKKDPNGLRTLRKILSVEEPPIHLILQPIPTTSPSTPSTPSPSTAGTPDPVASIIFFLQHGDEIQQLDAAWCITNLATGTHEQTTTVLPAAPYLIQHLSGSNAALVEQCVWALGNISADCVEYRDVLRANGVLKPLVSILQRYALSTTQRHSSQTLSLARTAAFALANQARGQNSKLEDLLDLNIAPALVRVLEKSDTSDEMSDGAVAGVPLSTEVLIEVAWVLTYLTAQVPNSIILVDAGILPLLLRHLQSSVSGLVIPILRTVGNIIARSDTMTDQLLDPALSPPLVPTLRSLLSSDHRAIKKEATYVISNIAGGTQAHVDQLVHHGVVPALSDLLRTSQFDIAREAAYALSNIGSNAKHMDGLVSAGVVGGILSLLTSPDSEVAHLALTFVEMLLTFHPQGAAIIQQANGIEKLESLQFHKNQELYHLANQLIDKYFGEDFEDSSCEPAEERIEYPPWRVRQV